MVFLTAQFKIHNPTQRKRQVLDHAFREYRELYAWLLAWAEREIERLAEDSVYYGKRGPVYRETAVLSCLPSIAKCSGDIHSSLKDACRRHVARTLASYLAIRLVNPTASFPSPRVVSPGDHEAALDALRQAADVDENAWRRLVGAVLRKGDEVMPLLFPRADGAVRNRNFSLLVDPERQKTFALLYLLPGGHYLGRPLETRGNLRQLGSDEPWDSHSTCAIVVPLEYGRWHEQRFLNAGGVPKSAFLLRRDEEYYLNVVFEMPAPEPVEMTGAVLAVDRNAVDLVAAVLLDADGCIIEERQYTGQAARLRNLAVDYRRRLRWLQRRGQSVKGVRFTRVSRAALYEIAKDLANLAREYGAQIVLLPPPGQRRKGKAMKRRCVLPLEKLRPILEQKALETGLPPPTWVSAWRDAGPGDRGTTTSDGRHIVRLSWICGNCGRADKAAENRRQGLFSCPACGYTNEIGLNTALNIGLAWLAESQS